MTSDAKGARPRRDSTAPKSSRASTARQDKPAVGTKVEDTVGGDLERRVGRLEFAEGAVVRLRVPVAADDAESGRDVLTDVDVLSVDVDSRLRVSRSVLECKSGKGARGEPYTLVWLAGFKQLLSLDRAALVRQTITARGRALARRLGLPVLEMSAIERREKAHAWLPETFAHVDGIQCLEAERRTDIQLKGLPDVPPALAAFLRHGALLAEPPALLAAVHAYGSAVARQGVLPEPAATVLASHALSCVVMAALTDAGDLDSTPPELLATRLSRALTVGDPDDSSLLGLLERADNLIRHVQDRTHRAYVDAGAEAIPVEVPSLRETIAAPPDFIADYVDLVERLRANPQIASDLLQTVELSCFEALVGGTAWKAPAFAHLFTAEHKGLLLVALRCLTRIAGDQVGAQLERLRQLNFDSAGVPARRGKRDTQTASALDEAVDSIRTTAPTTGSTLGNNAGVPGSEPDPAPDGLGSKLPFAEDDATGTADGTLRL